jgi:hypothetical protein
MTDVVPFVALSLLPPWCWLHAAERLRHGDCGAIVLDRLLHKHWRDEPEKRVELTERAEAAVQRATDSGIAAIPWNDAAYPPALTTIADPPRCCGRGAGSSRSAAPPWQSSDRERDHRMRCR